MAEYIEREAAKLRIFEYGVRHRNNSSISSACENLERQMNSIPVADVRPVVMCRDCKWTKKDDMDDPAIYCRKWDRWEMPPDGFCWLGRKKEES